VVRAEERPCSPFSGPAKFLFHGDEYLDYLCSFGTNLLGLKHPKAEAAARRQQEKVDCFCLPSDHWVPLARKIAETAFR
jgi:glutamate-1-semialdehyde 2,1-aminomutase